MSEVSKSILAKLLATENIRVEHHVCKTASFDTKNRVLILPIWASDMSNSLSDMLIGHEVGHALNTPAEGWHTELSTTPNFKTFLNVIEDIRIEKKIKTRYPGLRKQFFKAYNELHEKDFFGLGNTDVNNLLLIDRINVRYKLGVRMPVIFSIEEGQFIRRCDTIETWEDTVALAKDLYEYCKEEKKAQKKEKQEQQDEDDEEGMFDESDEDSDSENAGDDSFDDEMDEDSDEESPEKEQITDADKGNADEELELDDDEPVSSTDIAFRDAENQLAAGVSTPQMHLYLPEVDLDKILITAKDFPSSSMYITRVIGGEAVMAKWESELLIKFNRKNNNYINYLAKEFELRKNARQLMRSRESKTGIIDINKVWGYKFNEDIFLSNTEVPGGKNHGLVMLVDWSGSMTTNMKNTIEQVLVQVAFCRKVGIPFAVLAFQSKIADKFIPNNDIRGFQSGFSSVVDDLHCGDLTLVELITSSLRGQEYNTRFRKLLGVGQIIGRSGQTINIEGYNYREHDAFMAHPLIRLNSTPLDAALLAMPKYIKQFQAQYKIDIMNLMVLTDGDDTNLPQYYIDEKTKMPLRYNISNKHAYLCNRKSMLKIRIYDADSMTKYILQHLKDILNCNLIGFFIVDKNPKRAIVQYAKITRHDILDKMLHDYKQDKYIGLTNCGYDEYFLIAGGKDLEIAEDVIEAKDHKKGSVLRAFMKNQTRKGQSRIFLRQLTKRLAIAA